MDKNVCITFLGDLCPINRVGEAIIKDDLSKFSNIRELLSGKDLVIANLECPLTNSNERIKKNGPNLKGHPKTVNLLEYLNIGVTALANNHILDYGEKGLADTLIALKNSGIECVGAGLTEKEAKTPFIKTINGIRICLINVCEKEFNILPANKSGANTFEIISLIKQIEEHRKSSDFLILFYHGGIEKYKLPTPEMFRMFDFLLENGIDIIVCNHQHVISGYRSKGRNLIFYGLGNFIFDWPSIRNNDWNYGVMINITLNKENPLSFEIIPFEQCNGSPGLVFNSLISEKIQHEISVLNSKMIEKTIEEEWKTFLSKKHAYLLADILFQNRYIRYALRKTGLINFLITGEHERRIFNYFSCQSLSEFARDTLKMGSGLT